MKLSFLIVNWNGGEVFKNCIASIESEASATLGDNDYEIVVVDNDSRDLNLPFLNTFGNLRLYRNDNNEMFSVGTNQTVKFSMGKYIFLLNNDIVFTEGSLRPILEKIVVGGADAVVPRLINMDGSTQLSVRAFPTLRNIFFSAVGLNFVHRAFDGWRLKHFDYNREQFVEQPMFSAMLTSRAVWNMVGDMDERLPLLFNDVDWFKRFHDLGLKCLYLPESKLFHVHGMSVNKNYYKKVLESSKSMKYYFQKHLPRNLFNSVAVPLLVGYTFCLRLMFEFLKSPKSPHKQIPQ